MVALPRSVRVLAVELLVLSATASGGVRAPAVAGGFYPADPADLRVEVGRFLGTTGEPAGPPPIALIVPHAGYVFSGATAGRTFAAVADAEVRRVILLGPSHRVGFRGGALPAPSVDGFATPLGEVKIDRRAVDALRSEQPFSGPARAHDGEHCLEVELPFLQTVAPDARIVPVLVGVDTDLAVIREMSRALAPLLGPGTLVVVSSDFTHHGRAYRYAPFPVDDALPARIEAVTRTTADRAAAVDPRGFWAQVAVSGDTVCGARPILVLLELLAHAADARGETVGVTTSAKVSGSLDQIVAYAGVAFHGSWHEWRADPEAKPAPLTADQGATLVRLARAALESHLRHDGSLAEWFAAHPVSAALEAPSGAFVTVNNSGARVRTHGRLRGCIGSIEPRQPLVDAIVHAAVSAAHDPRFPPLAADELDGIEVEVSVLTPPRRIPDPRTIALGRDGIILERDGSSAVFLPQVPTEQGWDLDTTLAQLARKAGLPVDGWRGASFQTFTAEVFHEEAR